MVHSGWGSRFVPGGTQYTNMELILLLYLTKVGQTRQKVREKNSGFLKSKKAFKLSCYLLAQGFLWFLSDVYELQFDFLKFLEFENVSKQGENLLN